MSACDAGRRSSRFVPSAGSERAGRKGDVGILERIWIKRRRRAAMEERDEAYVVVGHGLEDNVEQARRRQVTLLSREAWETMMEELGADLDPSARRANLLVRDVDLEESRGRTLKIGEWRLRIEGETKPCRRMDEALDGLQEAMRPAWRGGAFGRVLRGGRIRVGDPVRWVEEARS